LFVTHASDGMADNIATFLAAFLLLNMEVVTIFVCYHITSSIKIIRGDYVSFKGVFIWTWYQIKVANKGGSSHYYSFLGWYHMPRCKQLHLLSVSHRRISLCGLEEDHLGWRQQIGYTCFICTTVQDKFFFEVILSKLCSNAWDGTTNQGRGCSGNGRHEDCNYQNAGVGTKTQLFFLPLLSFVITRHFHGIWIWSHWPKYSNSGIDVLSPAILQPGIGLENRRLECTWWWQTVSNLDSEALDFVQRRQGRAALPSARGSKKMGVVDVSMAGETPLFFKGS